MPAERGTREKRRLTALFTKSSTASGKGSSRDSRHTSQVPSSARSVASAPNGRSGRVESKALPSPPLPPSTALVPYGSRHVDGGPIPGPSSEIPRLQRRLDDLQIELERAKKELSMAKQELESNRVFGNKADVVSETDIKDKVNALNDCVYQLASAIADAHLNNIIELSDSPLDKETKNFFGRPIYKLAIYAKRNPTHPRILASLQACINHFCVNVLSSEFHSIGNPERTQTLQQLFDEIKASQRKAVSARWRALAYSHSEILRQDQQSLFALLISRLINLYGFPEGQFQAMYGEEFSELINKTMELRKMMYGDYVSGDMHVFSPLPGTEYDSVKMQVDDPRIKTRKTVVGTIACTTSIGIARTLYIRQRQGDKWIDEEEYNVLLPASVLMSIDDE